MTLRRQLLLLLVIHLFAALAAWKGYRIGYERGQASMQIQWGPWSHPKVQGSVPKPRVDREKWDANWRLN